jgi:16S rRNA (cytosine967-C5)-methyltransferase
MFSASYCTTVTTIYKLYDGSIPLYIFLKSYFKEHKKYGSRDRRIIADLLYGVYRLGKQVSISLEQRIFIGAFISSRVDVRFFDGQDEFYTQHYLLSILEKIALVKEKFGISIALFDTISKGVNETKAIANLFSQPKLYIRVRKNKKKIVETLEQHQIAYTTYSNAIGMPINTKLDTFLIEDDYVIQDISSQEIGNYFNIQDKEKWWDCCAASGGKSIMLLDKNNVIDLTVSDIRKSSLRNLETRFKQYKLTKQQALVLDCTNEEELTKLPHVLFDKIICDAPCSGSGTWSRTPEQYYFFSTEKLKAYADLQFNIAKNALTKLKTAGELYYITCSIYTSENEAIVEKLLASNSNIFCKQMTVVNNFTKGGDALFVAVLSKK